MRTLSICSLVALSLLTVLVGGCSSKTSDNSAYDLSLIPIRQGAQEGFIDWEGNYAIVPQFAGVSFFQEGLSCVQDYSGLYGFINKKGTYVIPPTYVLASSFSEGIAIVTEPGGYLQGIDKKGKVLFTCEMAQRLGDFHDGVAVFMSLEGKYGAIDRKGNEVIAPTSAFIDSFSDGLAAFQDERGQYGFIDKKGQYVINPQFAEVSRFANGLAVVSNGSKYGFIDKKGHYVINPQFDYAEPFSEGVALVAQGFSCGYIDTKGQYVINPQFRLSTSFRDGIAIAISGEGGLCGMMDKSGTYKVNPQFDEVGYWCKRGAIVKSGDKWGIVDPKGKYTVMPQFDNLKLPERFYEYSRGSWLLLRSQHYDTSELISNLQAFLGSSSTSVCGYNQATTYGSVRASGKKHEIYSRDVATFDQTVELAKGIKISNPSLSFDGNVVIRYGFFFRSTEYDLDRRARQFSFSIGLDDALTPFLPTIMYTLKANLGQQYLLVDPYQEESDSAKHRAVTLKIKQDLGSYIRFVFDFPEYTGEEAPIEEVEAIDTEEASDVADVQAEEPQPSGAERDAVREEAKKAVPSSTPKAPQSEKREVQKPAPKPASKPASKPSWQNAEVKARDGYAIVRESKSSSGEVIDTIDNGTRVSVLVLDQEWCQIKWQGETAYIRKQDVALL